MTDILKNWKPKSLPRIARQSSPRIRHDEPETPRMSNEELDKLIEENRKLGELRKGKTQERPFRDPDKVIKVWNRIDAKEQAMFTMCQACKARVYEILDPTRKNGLDICTKTSSGYHVYNMGDPKFDPKAENKPKQDPVWNSQGFIRYPVE